MAEESIYSDANVTVTTARIMVSGTTYALRNITSVKMITIPPNNQGAIILLVVGILLGVVAFPTSSRDISCGVILFLIGVGLVAGGLFALGRLKASYSVVVASSAGEIRALTSIDKQYISKIVSSINEAIIHYR